MRFFSIMEKITKCDIFALSPLFFYAESLKFIVFIGISCYYLFITKLKEFFMEYISTKEASSKWGISPTRITILANEGRIPGAKKFGKNWLIPASAIKPERKAGRPHESKQKTSEFSFPLYHFRPDYNDIKPDDLTEQQKLLLSAESAVLECRYEDAYPILNSILESPDDIAIEIGCLWNAGICCIGLNKPKDFSGVYLRLQMLFTKDFPYKDDYVIILDSLKTYMETLNTVAQNNSIHIEVQEQCVPMMSLMVGYSTLAKESMNPGTTDLSLLRLNLCLLKNTSAVIVMEMMHLYLLGIYFLRQDMIGAQRHAKIAVQLAYENKYYFPLVTYYRYFSQILSPILEQYPDDFKKHCHQLISQYEKNYIAFATALDKYAITSKLSNVDFPYIYGILMNTPITVLANELGVARRTAHRKLDMICAKLGVSNKKELKYYLQSFM